jgi:hypothetical protein
MPSQHQLQQQEQQPSTAMHHRPHLASHTHTTHLNQQQLLQLGHKQEHPASLAMIMQQHTRPGLLPTMRSMQRLRLRGCQLGVQRLLLRLRQLILLRLVTLATPPHLQGTTPLWAHGTRTRLQGLPQQAMAVKAAHQALQPLSTGPKVGPQVREQDHMHRAVKTRVGNGTFMSITTQGAAALLVVGINVWVAHIVAFL